MKVQVTIETESENNSELRGKTIAEIRAYIFAENARADDPDIQIISVNVAPEFKQAAPTYICKHCGMDIRIRNPSGYCDHLYYPENCKVCERQRPR